ncbi:ATP-dependent Clp protease ATP-binding subunit [Candidatus Uhrbacteria bacterium]|nr:ATP-dependent Clp protease ATP-binding subunit [Candidatus Uhrbacteria bacterium]
MSTILDRFTLHLRHVLGRSSTLAGEMDSETVSPALLLLGLALERGSVAAEVLARARLTPEIIRGAISPSDALDTMDEVQGGEEPSRPLAPNARRALEKAALAAATNGHRYIGTEHLLSGVLEVGDEQIAALLAQQHVDANAIRQHLTIVYRSTSKFPELTADLLESKPATGEETKAAPAAGDPAQKAPALEFFAKDLTAPASTSALDPVIGREHEIERAIQILCRRTKNNPILLGEPGVGKTAIVEGLAKRIAERDVPDVLIGKRILALDLALLVAGTIYRGEFESRLKQILDEVRQDSNIILFIDEIHMIMGAGAASGSLDAANILKPALAKGEIHCIGATTYTEFKKHVENDPALERRFQTVHVAEPSPEASAEILRGLKPYYEQFHHVKIGDDAITAAVRFADRYLAERRFPDKAIDLIDEAAARVRVHAKNDPLLRKVSRVGAALEGLEERKRKAVAEERYADALALQQEATHMAEDAKSAKARIQRRSTAQVGAIGASDVAAVVAQMVGISAEDILLTEHERILALGDRLRERIVGQDDAIRSIASALQRAVSGMAPPKRPVASFLLLGPTGVGKTETAKVIAELLFQHRDALIRLDMSEFSEGFTVSKLIGAPAGYVGYREGSKLTDAVRKRPASVVLFDEIEKAHPDIWNLLLQILEDGRITDATGREVSFTNTIIVMTSNIGAGAFTQAGIGFIGGTTSTDALAERFTDIQADALRELRQRFRPELLNRIDATIIYRPLMREHLETIAQQHLEDFARRIIPQGLALTIDPTVAPWIAARAFDPASGARAVRRLLQEHVENPVAQGIIEDRFRSGSDITIHVVGDAIVATTESRPTPVKRPVRARAAVTR